MFYDNVAREITTCMYDCMVMYELFIVDIQAFFFFFFFFFFSSLLRWFILFSFLLCTICMHCIIASAVILGGIHHITIVECSVAHFSYIIDFFRR